MTAYLPSLTAELCLSSGAFDFEASDTFTRADNAGTLGTADSRQPWVAAFGTWGITGNKAYCSALSGSLLAGMAYVRCLAGGDVQATMSTIANGSGIVFRVQDEANYWVTKCVTGTGQWITEKVEDGAFTLVASAAGAVTNGTVVKVRAEGSSIRVYINGAAIGSTISDDTFASAANAGLYAESTSARFDNFVASFIWTDITDYLCGLMGTVGVTIQRGRQHELSQMETGTCDVLLQNDDRRFDPLYTLSPYYPNLLPLRKIRLSATWESVSHPLFVGHIERWPLDYNMPATDGTVKVTAVDRLAVIGSGLWDAYPDTVLGMAPDAYWRMGAA